MRKPGDKIHRYVIEAAIGQGGMGAVYRARDGSLERHVAIKLLADPGAKPEATERLLREARAAAALDHPNAVAIFDVGEDGGAPYIVMELVAGRTLREVLAAKTTPWATRARWLVDAGNALAAAHRRGLVHRDVKPENVMVRDDGVVKVLDFGIARRTAGQTDPLGPTAAPALATLTREGVIMGTPVYMAPEQIRGTAVDGRADQFAWGVLAFELFTGRPPWRGGDDPLAVVASVLLDAPDEQALVASAVPAPVCAVVMRALAKQPAARFASMDDAVAALERALRGEAPAPAEPPVRRAEAPAAKPAPRMATLAQRYSTAEVREILSLAVDNESAKQPDTRLGFEDLVAAAREVGIDETALREASLELRARAERASAPAVVAQEDADRDAWFRRKRRAFFRHAGIFLIVNLAMLVLGALTGGLPWTLIPGLLWAVGLGIHGLTALSAHQDDWAAVRQRELRRAEKRRRRSTDASPLVLEAAAQLRRTGEALRAQFAGAAANAHVRVALESANAEAERAMRARSEEEQAAPAVREARDGAARRRRER